MGCLSHISWNHSRSKFSRSLEVWIDGRDGLVERACQIAKALQSNVE